MVNNNFLIATSALELLKDGIHSDNKVKILEAYNMVEHESFSWDGLDVVFSEFDELVDTANLILFQV